MRASELLVGCATCIFGAAILIGVLGCGGANPVLVAPPKDRKFIENEDGEIVPLVHVMGAGIEERDGGEPNCELSFRVATHDETLGSQWICVKRRGRRISLPTRIALLSSEGSVSRKPFRPKDKKAFCDEKMSGAVEGEKGKEFCVWNGRFAEVRPMNFHFSSAKLQTGSPNAPLKNVLGAVRVFRNGQLVYTWTRSQSLVDPSQLLIAGTSLRDGYPPHESEIALYVLPTNIGDDVLAQFDTVHQSTSGWRMRLNRALSSLATDPSSPVAPLAPEYNCYAKRVRYVAAAIEYIANSAAGANASDANWKAAQKELNETAEAAQDRVAIHDAAMKVKAATAEPIDIGRAPAALGTVSLEKNDAILIMEQRNRIENGLYSFDAKGKPLVRIPHSRCKATPPALRAATPQSSGPLPADVAVGDLLADDCMAPHAVIRVILQDGVATLRPTEASFHIEVSRGANAGAFQMRARAGTGDVDVTLVPYPPSACTKPQILTDELKTRLRTAMDEYAKHLIDESAFGQKLAQIAENVRTAAGTDLEASKVALSRSVKLWAEGKGDALVASRALVALEEAAGPVSVVEQQAADLAALFRKVRDGAARDLTSPHALEQSYQLFARGLGEADDLFEKRNPNPPALESESVLKMSYRDPSQTYFLAAWNGVPIPATGSSSGIKTEPKVDYLIPIIDFIGWRWQAGAPTHLDFRLGVGMLGTRETREDPDGSEELTNFNVGGQINFGLSSLRLGAGYMIREDEASGTRFGDTKNVRVLLGADIIRMITGKNTEVASSPGSIEPAAEQ